MIILTQKILGQKETNTILICVFLFLKGFLYRSLPRSKVKYPAWIKTCVTSNLSPKSVPSELIFKMQTLLSQYSQKAWWIQAMGSYTHQGCVPKKVLISTSFLTCCSLCKLTLTSSIRRDRKGNCQTISSLQWLGLSTAL